MDDMVTLAEAAEMLGVHYMTAYRYVRDGRLSASKVAGRWTVAHVDVEALRAGEPAGAPEPHDLDELIEALVGGDDQAAWRCAIGLAGEPDPPGVVERSIVPAMVEIGERWADGRIGIGAEHRATATATRILGRLGELGEPRGRKRGHLIIGAPTGDDHSLPVSIAASLARHEHFEVTELGADVAPERFCEAAASLADDADAAVAIVVTTDAGRSGARAASDRLAECYPGLTRLVGGGVVADGADAAALGATAWDGDFRQSLALLRD